MKINGHTCEGPKPEVVVIPKGTVNYVFKARLIETSEWAEFQRVCPMPNPPSITTKDGTKSDVNDKTYQKEITDWTQAKTDFLILKSLSATEGLEWDKVDFTIPATWCNWANDLQDAGFHEPEIAHIINTVYEAQGMNSSKIEAATKSFLAGQGADQ